jgi:6-pyruvoyltetrahydropterin/6-carboxytetrahydropterin synthase
MIITKEFQFCAGHRLFGYTGPCKNIHGHNYKVQVTFNGNSLDGMGFLVDFSVLKEKINPIINELDHCIMLNSFDPLVGLLHGLTEMVILPNNPTVENIAKLLFKKIDQAGIENVTLESVKVWETDTSFVEVQYV